MGGIVVSLVICFCMAMSLMAAQSPIITVMDHFIVDSPVQFDPIKSFNERSFVLLVYFCRFMVQFYRQSEGTMVLECTLVRQLVES